jgi:hypothetical protein|tara:strand:+ start:456 stop:1292 length:837 start_codon:yes stop_codon:yes gene_type:complete
MKFSLWTQYGALNSKPIFDAFANSLNSNGHVVVYNDSSADINVIWSVLFNGRMAGNKAVWEQQKPTIVLEVGGIKRGTTWKVGLNGINRDAYFGPSGNNNTRANELGLKLSPWKYTGEYILIAGQHDKSLQWKDMPSMATWVHDTITFIRAQTDRPIIFRPHPRCPLPAIEHDFKDVKRQTPKQIQNTYDDFDMQFDNIWATVSWSSNPGIHSVINGVPAFTGPSSLAFDVAEQNLRNIDNPLYCDRTQWLNDYAHTEYTIEEISQGIPLKHLTSKLI